MSDEGERACPLCAEEMDLTDQQLKPCKCGYEICVWCWHHIMDMAEKDQTQGRCPACRTPYNKEKIVGTAANCERLVSEMNMEKKIKSQKAKSKISDGRKQLSSVRVIQRNLVYIVGLPLSLADDDLLQHRDYFGQYGKVLKVSISRTAAGTIQQFANSTCSVYITYSKEEEAVRCIQSVHGFVLDGRSLRACFGTTKYCHAWLRNVPCSNPDCLYLHEIGTQEDSFTKDEIISAYTRSRVQQVTGATSNMQRRSGNVLPPPVDECHVSSFTLTGKSNCKSASNNTAASVKGSPPKSSSDRSTALPSAASWGARVSNGHPPMGNLACSNGPSKPKPETCSGSLAFSTAVAAAVHVPLLHAHVGKKLIKNAESVNNPHKGEQEPPERGCRQNPSTDSNTSALEAPVHLHCPPSPEDKGRCISEAPDITTPLEHVSKSWNPAPDKDLNVSAQGNNDNLCSGIVSMNITRHTGAEHSGDNRLNSSPSGNIIANLPINHGLQQHNDFRELSTSIALGKTVASSDDIWVPKEQSGLRPGSLTRNQFERESDLLIQGAKSNSQVAFLESTENLQSSEEQKLSHSGFVTSTSYVSNPSHSFHHSDHSSLHSPTPNVCYGANSLIQDSPFLDNKVDNGLVLRPPGISAVFNGYPEDIVNSYVDSDRKFEHSSLKKHIGRSEGEAVNAEQSVAKDMGESSIISNILSLDFDPWEESLTSPQNLVKLLGEADKHQADKRQGPLALSNSWKVQNSNKSRFSFARQDECRDLPSNVGPSLCRIEQMFEESPLSHDFVVNRDFNFDEVGDCNGFSTFNAEEPDNFAGSYSYLSSNKLSGSRPPVSAPPGFSSPNKAPPPGFTSYERIGPNFDAISGNHFLEASSLLRNPYQSPQTGNIGIGTDIEFMDPAILAVGKGRLPVGPNNGVSLDMRSNFSSQSNAVENEARFQSLMQRSSPSVQNHRFSGFGNGFAPFSDSYGLPSRIMEHSVANNLSQFSQVGHQQSRTSMMSNGQWNGWNDVKSASDMGMAELLRTDGLGFNKIYPGYSGYEDSKFRMPSTGDIYNRTHMGFN